MLAQQGVALDLATDRLVLKRIRGSSKDKQKPKRARTFGVMPVLAFRFLIRASTKAVNGMLSIPKSCGSGFAPEIFISRRGSGFVLVIFEVVTVRDCWAEFFE